MKSKSIPNLSKNCKSAGFISKSMFISVCTHVVVIFTINVLKLVLCNVAFYEEMKLDWIEVCFAKVLCWKLSLRYFNGCGTLTYRKTVARLSFLMPNSRNFAFSDVVWHEKMLFGMYVIVCNFFDFFSCVWRLRKKVVWHFWRLVF